MKLILLTCLIVTLTACANNPNRAGCTYNDGKGRYGTFTQYAKGNIKGAHVYIGENVKSVKITCNPEKQEVLYKDI